MNNPPSRPNQASTSSPVESNKTDPRQVHDKLRQRSTVSDEFSGVFCELSNKTAFNPHHHCSCGILEFDPYHESHLRCLRSTRQCD